MQQPSSGKPSVYVRLPLDVAAALDAASRLADVSRAGWVRKRIVEALPPSEGSSLALSRSPPRRSVTFPPADLVEVAKLAGNVARANGALVQMTKALRESSHPAHLAAEDVLADLRSTQEDLLGVVTGLRRQLDV
ncbi:MAG: hypothetical protein AB1592_03875 [Pseudomonadota bacterium]